MTIGNHNYREEILTAAPFRCRVVLSSNTCEPNSALESRYGEVIRALTEPLDSRG